MVVSTIVLGYGLTIAACSLRGFPERLNHGRSMPFLSDKPLGEDAFYMMAIGWNLGTGQGLSLGGQPTTGTQPLMTFLYAGLAAGVHAAGGDKWTFARAVLAFNAALFIAFAAITASLARVLSLSEDRAAITALATVLTITNYTLFRVFTYGLETGLYVIVGGLCALASIHLIRSPRTMLGVFGLGASAGAAALARIDFLVVFGAFLGLAWLRRQLTFRDAALAGSIAAVIVLPWLMWVHHVTGSWMPTSGQSQMAVITVTAVPARLLALVWALTHHASPWLYPELVRSAAVRLAPDHDVLWKVTVSVMLLITAFIVARQARHSVAPTAWNVMLTWLWAIAALISIYVIFFWPTYFYTRYSALLVLFTIPLLTAGVYAMIGHRLTAVNVLSTGVAVFAVTAAVTLHRGEAGNTYSVTARFIETQVPPAEKIGAFSSGVFGYFFENVLNLDGKVNAAAMIGRREDRLGRYINSSGITLLLDWPETIQTFVPDAYLESCWEQCTTRLLPEQGSCFTRRSCRNAAW